MPGRRVAGVGGGANLSRLLGPITVDILRIPQGATCTLNGTRVQGTIKVERAATLRANGVTVIGNVQGENAADVRVLAGSSGGGSVQVVQGRAARVRTAASAATSSAMTTPPSCARSAIRSAEASRRS
ncbi:MAG: hypothetical protein ACRD0U_07075, partial [Acidimicrobiales bacterium]